MRTVASWALHCNDKKQPPTRGQHTELHNSEMDRRRSVWLLHVSVFAECLSKFGEKRKKNSSVFKIIDYFV